MRAELAVLMEAGGVPADRVNVQGSACKAVNIFITLCV